MPAGIEVEVNRDNSRSIRVSVANVKRTLFEGAALTVLIAGAVGSARSIVTSKASSHGGGGRGPAVQLAFELCAARLDLGPREDRGARMALRP